MKKHITDSEELWVNWFPETSGLLFKHFNVQEIKLKVKDPDGKLVEFKFTKQPNINPLADYRS
jgi:hypothetical protein